MHEAEKNKARFNVPKSYRKSYFEPCNLSPKFCFDSPNKEDFKVLDDSEIYSSTPFENSFDNFQNMQNENYYFVPKIDNKEILYKKNHQEEDETEKIAVRDAEKNEATNNFYTNYDEKYFEPYNSSQKFFFNTPNQKNFRALDFSENHGTPFKNSFDNFQNMQYKSFKCQEEKLNYQDFNDNYMNKTTNYSDLCLPSSLTISEKENKQNTTKKEQFNPLDKIALDYKDDEENDNEKENNGLHYLANVIDKLRTRLQNNESPKQDTSIAGQNP